MRRCVRCEETMVGAFLGVVAVDECPGCKGLYLDQGEIDTVAERVLNLGARAWQTTKALTSTCVGCRSTFRLGDLMTTAQGLACRQCFFAVDGGSSTILAPVAQRTTGGLLGSGSTRTLDSAAIGLLTILGG